MFITFEGLDFSGKSTQIFLLRERLENRGEEVVVIREPGGTSISEKVRDILLDKKNQEMVFETELLLFSASRAQLVREVILPHLEKKHFVLSDRFHDSSVAYQGFGRGVDIETIMEIQRFAIGKAIPDLTFFIDIPLEMIESRKIKHKIELDRIELMKNDFYTKVREGYFFLAEKEKRFRVIDGTKTKEEVHQEIMKYIELYENGMAE